MPLATFATSLEFDMKKRCCSVSEVGSPTSCETNKTCSVNLEFFENQKIPQFFGNGFFG